MAEIITTSVLADAKTPFLKAETRWDYLEDKIKLWKNYIRWRSYMYILGIAGIIFLFTFPLLAPPCLALSLYYERRKEHMKDQIGSSRIVMIGH
ncbi:MAG: hypothetical protein ACP5O3_03895 [Candidatus Micrarchaeia archaeon]|jgi:hypothetical protein